MLAKEQSIGGGVTDADLEHLKGLLRLKYLHLDQTQNTDAGGVRRAVILFRDRCAHLGRA